MTGYTEAELLDLITRLLPGWGSDEGTGYEAYEEACALLNVNPEQPGQEERKRRGYPQP